MLAAFLAWRARTQVVTAAASPAPGTRMIGPTAASFPLPITPLSLARLALAAAAMVAGAIAIVCAVALGDALLDNRRATWSHTGQGLMACAAGAWLTWSIWRFRRRLTDAALASQLFDGVLRLAAIAVGLMIAVGVANWAQTLLREEGRRAGLDATYFLWPALVLPVGAALGCANRDGVARWFPVQTVKRCTLLGAAVGGALGVAMSLVIAATISRSPSAALVWGIACALVAFGAWENARSTTTSLRRFAVGYVGAFLLGLGVQTPVFWFERFTSGRSVLDAWSYLVVFLPFVLAGSLALGAGVAILGWRLYRRSLAAG